MRYPKQIAALAVIGALAAITLTACGSGSSSSSSSGAASGKSLVLDTQFDAVTFDPQRDFEFTGNLVDAQVYETALTYTGDNLTDVKPGVASYKLSADNKTVTLTLTGTHTFADGKAVTADDIVYTYQRLLGIAGNPSFLLDDPAGKPIQVAKVDDKTVTLTSSVANPALPTILPNPSLGIVEKSVVTGKGGTTDAKDDAQAYLDAHSAGSGPYQIQSADVKSRVVLVSNPKYAGTKPTYTKVIIKNAQASTQKVDLQSGQAQLATDISPQDANSLKSGGKIDSTSGSSLYTLYTWFNQQPKYGKTVASTDFLDAVRHGIDYDALAKLVGPGTVQPGGIVPQGIFGALKSDPNNSYDPAAAKAALAKSDYNGEEINYLYDSEASAGNASYSTIAQTIQAQLKKIGINLKLTPQPSATALDTFRSHTYQAGFALWGADYPDASDYIAFAPNQTVGLRAGWATADGAKADRSLSASGVDVPSADQINPLFQKALTTTDSTARQTAWEDVQKQMNKTGPFIPVLQPGSQLVFAKSLSGVVYNPLWTVQLASLK